MHDIHMKNAFDMCRAPNCHLARSLSRGIVGIVVMGCLLGLASCSQSASRSGGVNRDLGTPVVRREQVLLLPTITGGEGGWCVTLNSGACPTANPVRAFHTPIVAENWSGQGIPSVNTGFVLTTSRVAAVSINGSKAIPTHAEPMLPDQLRAAVVELRGGSRRHVPGFNVEVPVVPLSSLRFTPLNSKGEPIPQSSKQDTPLAFYLPGRGWSRPASAPQGVCGIQANHLGGLVAPAGFVLTHVEPHPGLIGRPFLSCASSSYTFEGWPLVASVLLDAAHPGSTPAPLPTMKPLVGHSGFFQALVVEGEAVARRIPGAWLVVANGSGVSQRLLVLEHLRATVHL
jgi:hypothetical protein